MTTAPTPAPAAPTPAPAAAGQPPAVDNPRHPLHALVTFELRDYRRQLQDAIAYYDTKHPPPAERDDLQATLNDVIAEQESRKKLTRA